MVVWFSLETSKKYGFKELKDLLVKLHRFHAYHLNCYNSNAGNQILINADAVLEDMSWKLALLKEEFILSKAPHFKTVDLSHIFTISSLDASNEDTYRYTDDPTSAKQETAARYFSQLIAEHPEFQNFQLRYNYEY